MRVFIAIAVTGVSLAGCSSFSLDTFKPTPPTVQVQLDSVPSGADARTSLGPGCTTPCSVAVPVSDNRFSVTYTLNNFQPTTVPVQVILNPGNFSTAGSTVIDPNPVLAELQPASPPPKAAQKSIPKPKRPKPPKATAAAAAASPFPDPTPPPANPTTPSR